MSGDRPMSRYRFLKSSIVASEALPLYIRSKYSSTCSAVVAEPYVIMTTPVTSVCTLFSMDIFHELLNDRVIGFRRHTVTEIENISVLWINLCEQTVGGLRDSVPRRK